ncbi:MAG: endonuclease VIII [Myxococcota bacterium]
MPEGPEIHRQADRLQRVLAGEIAQAVFFAFPHLRVRGERLPGLRITSVSARGKAILTAFEDGTVVYSHNQLYGRWLVRRLGTEIRTNRQLRFAVETDRHQARLYSASSIELLNGDVNTHPYLSKLGPDPLGEGVTKVMIHDHITNPRFARRRLDGLLLDQGFVGGIGNYLRSEILFYAGLHHGRSPQNLDPKEAHRLSGAIHEMMFRSYGTGGLTNDPESVRARKADGALRKDYRHYVFGRAGRPCPRCCRSIERIEATGRRLYFCPACQT